MAYNVLKGIVEGSVDQHADQEIGGVKVFKNTVSASVFGTLMLKVHVLL